MDGSVTAGDTFSSERMRIDENGNVGIGDTSPAALLTVGNGDLFQVSGNDFRLRENGGSPSFYGIFDVGDLTANRTYLFPNLTNASDTVCFVLEGNCAGSGDGITGNGTANQVAYFDSTDSITSSANFTFNGADVNIDSNTLFVQGSTDRVGIGTTGPTAPLHVLSNNSLTTGILRIEQDGTGDAGITYVSPDTGWLTGIDNSDSDKFKIANSTSDLATNTRLTIETGGNVGIGTTTPQKLLHIANGDQSRSRLRIENTNTGSGGRAFDLMAGVHNSTQQGFSIYDATSNAPRLVIDNSGNVGIGETSPGKKLTVVSTSAGALQYALRLQNADNTANTATGIAFNSHATTGASAYSKAGIVFNRTSNFGRGDLHFLVNNTEDTSEAALSDSVLTLQTGGNVGIGTTSPGNKLDVNGGIDATTLNTGHGDNELYAMDQNLQQADSPTFAGLTLNGDLDMNGNNIIDLGQLNSIWSATFDNTERSSHTAADGMIYNDLNFASDYTEFAGDGGGLSVYNAEDGWGAIYTTANDNFATPNFAGLNVTNNVNITAGVLQTGGTTRLSNAGALSNITGYSQGSGNFAISSTGTFSTGTGAVSLNGNTTVNADLTVAATGGTSVYRGFTSTTDPDVSGLVTGTTSGGLLEAPSMAHYVVGLRENGGADAFSIISGGGDYDTDSTYDTSILYAQADGNVGIGNTSPGSKLEVSGTTSLQGAVTVGSSTAAQGLTLYTDSNAANSLRFFNGTTQLGEITANDTTWLRINQSVNKNIYTPRYLRADGGLHVNGTAHGISATGILLNASLTGTYSNELTLSSVSNVLTGSIGQSTALAGAFTNLSGTGSITLSPSGTNDVVVNTDADSDLQLNGLGSGTGNALCIDTGASNKLVTCTVGSGGISGSGSANQVAYFDNTSNITSNANFTFNGADVNMDSNTLFVQGSTSRVGIGTTSPEFKLDVVGDTYVQGSLIADYQGVNHLPNGDFESGTTRGFTGFTGVTSTDSKNGTYAAYKTSNGSSLSTEYIPVDSNGYLSLEGWFKSVGSGGDSRMYFGTAAYDENKTLINGNGGTYGYCAASNTTIPNTWTKYTCTLRGEGTSNYNFPAGTRYVRALMLLNYQQDSTFETRIDGLKYVTGRPYETTSSGDILLGARATAGNVGIGTTTPNAKLEVAGGKILLDNSQAIQFNKTTGNAFDILAVDSSNNTILGSVNGGTGGQITLAGTSNQILFGTSGGSEYARFDASGNLGIGTTVPNQKLDVQGGLVVDTLDDGGTSALWVTRSGEEHQGLKVYADDRNLYTRYIEDSGEASPGTWRFINELEGGASYEFLTAQTNGDVSLTAGNVGIGLTNPTNILHVDGGSEVFHVNTGSASDSFTTNAPTVTAPKNAVTMFLGSGTGSESTSAYLADESSANLRFNGAAVAWGDLGYYPTGGDSGEYGHFRLSRTGSSIDRVPDAKLGVGSLYSAGNVGIGTTGPSELLTLASAGSANIRVNADTDNVTETDMAQLLLTQDGGVSTANFGMDGANNLVIGVNSTTSPNIYFGTNTTGTTFADSTTAKMTILSGGNVGIGDTTPAALLTVGNGDLFQVNGSGQVTYVNGATDTATQVCRNAAGQLAGCNTSGTGAAFVQGGNNFGATAVLGTNSNHDLTFRTNSVTRLTIDTSGNATLTGNLIVQGRTTQLSNFRPEYRWKFGGSTDLNWKKIADISIGTGLFAAASFQVDVLNANSNFGHSSNQIPLRYYVSAVRSSGTQDDPDNGTVAGPDTDYVRLVKTALGVYELQVRQPTNYRHMEVTARVTSDIGSATVTYVDNPADGSTTGTIYTADTSGYTQNFANVNVAGNLQTGGTTRLTSTGALQNITTIDASGAVTAGTYNSQTISNAASFTGTLATVGNITSGSKVITSRLGNAGTYDSTQVQGIWSIGNAYQVDTTANDFGAQYGITYAHTNAGTTTNKLPIAGWGHQILFTSGGVRNAAISLTGGHGYFAGNVGIGTTAPSDELDVVGDLELDGSDTRYIRFKNAANNDYASLGLLNGGIAISGQSVHSSNPHLVVANTGNVGIGMTNPSRALHVSGTALIQQDHSVNLLLDAVDAGGSPAITSSITLDGYDGRAKGLFFTDDGNSDEWFIGETYSSSGISIGYDTTAGSQSEYPANSILFANSSGSVGIGTTAPGAKLNVAGTSWFGADTGAGNPVRIEAGLIRMADNADSGRSLQIQSTQLIAGQLNSDAYNYADGAQIASIGRGSNQLLLDVTGNSSTDSAFRVTLDSTGNHPIINLANKDTGASTFYANSATSNVGIGTSNPGTKLEVAGDLTVAATGGTSVYRGFTSTSDSDISGLMTGTTSGGLLEAPINAHYVIGLRENGASDAFSIVSGGGDYSTDPTYDTSILYAQADGNIGIGTSTPGTKLDVVGDTELNGSLTVVSGSGRRASLINVPILEGGAAGLTRVYRNLANYESNSNTEAGAIVIDTGVAPASQMSVVTLKGYKYSVTGAGGAGHNIDIDINSYWNTATPFANRSYTNKGDVTFSQVRIGTNGAGNVVIVLGDTAETWSYPKLWLEKWISSHSSGADSEADNWSISTVTDLTGYSLNAVNEDTYIDSDSRFVNVTGDTMTGRLKMSGAATGSAYNQSSIELVQSWNSGAGESPRLGFHYSGAVASQIGFLQGDSSGDIAILDSPGTGYETLRVRDLKIGTTSVIDGSRNLINIGTINTGQGATEVHLMNQDIRTTDSVTFGNITNSGVYTANTSSTRDKLRVWSSGTYAIGMGNGYSYGYLNDYAMTFQMSDHAARGWWWGNSADTNAQGAMSLTTDGRLHVDQLANIGDNVLLSSTGNSYINTGNVGIGTTNPTQAKLSVIGDMYLGSSSGSSFMYNDSPAGQFAAYWFQSSGSDRWAMYKNTTSESGSSAGSDFTIARYDDTGTGVDAPFFIKRSTGFIRIGDSGGLPPTEQLHVNGGARITGLASCDTIDTDSNGVLSCGTDAVGGGGTAFVQNGNSFGALAVLGTNDSFDLALETAGTERLRIDTAGNVGIGTASPDTKLHVVGTARSQGVAGDIAFHGWNPNSPPDQGFQSSPIMRLSGVYDSNGTALFNTRAERHADIQHIMTTRTTSRLAVSVDGTEALSALSSGNVGIGTTTPNAALQLGNTLGNRRLVLWETGNNDHQFYGFGIQSNTLRYQTGATTADHVFYAGAGTSSSNELMRIQGDGNVGIGITNPIYKLDVAGQQRIAGSFAVPSGQASALYVPFTNTSSNGSGTSELSGIQVQPTISTSGGGTQLNNGLLIGAVSGTPGSGVVENYGVRIANQGRSGLDYSAGLLIDSQSGSDLTYSAIFNGGNVGIGTLTPGQELEVNGDIRLDSNGTATTNGLCHSGANSNTTFANRDIVACSSSPGDIAEWYEVTGDAEPGDILVASNETFTYEETQTNPATGEILPNKITRTISKLKRSSQVYEGRIIGVVSTSPYQVFGADIQEQGDNPHPIALSGRVMVKVAPGSDPVLAGDYLTTSDVAGHAMRATKRGQMIGKALEAWNPDSGKDSIMVYVSTSYADPEEIELDIASLNVSGQSTLSELNVTGTTVTQKLEVTGAAIINDLTVTNNIQTASLTVTGDALVEGGLVVEGNIATQGDLKLDGVGNTQNAITKKFVASKPITAGSVVIADPDNDGQVTTTLVRGDRKVIGIAATTAVNTGDEIEVAIGGSLQVKFDADTAVAGDLVISSDAEGMAANGGEEPKIGTVLGKATSKKDASGLVWILVTLQ